MLSDREEVQLHTLLTVYCCTLCCQTERRYSYTLLTLYCCTLCCQTISWPLFEVLTFLFLYNISLTNKRNSWPLHSLHILVPSSYGLLVFSITYPHSQALGGTLALNECGLSPSLSTCINLGENPLGANWTRVWMGQRFGMKPWRIEKSLEPARNLTSITFSSVQATDYKPHQLHYHSFPIRVVLSWKYVLQL